jgi:hypothetical protein
MAILSGLTISGGGITIVGGPTAAANDPYFMYNTLLLPGNGTNTAQNNTFTDGSTNNLSITRNGNTIQGTFSPYGGNWSNYFDGTGDYLTTPSSLAMALGSTFTVECWIYVLAWNVSSPLILDVRDSNIVGVIYLENNGTARMQTTGTGTIASQTGITLNTWIHVAFVSDATSSRVYVNGSNTGATNQGQALFPTTAKVGFIGADFSGGSNFNGYISNMRVVKDTALYTANFTPSTTPLTPITNTSLLTCADNRLIDDSINNLTITKFGNTSVQRFSPFSPSSITPTSYSGYFDGTGDYLTVPSTDVFAFGTGAYTIEAWVYVTSRSLEASIWATGAQNNNFLITTGGLLRLYNGTSYTGTTVIPLNTWAHVAVVRTSTASNGTQLFVNGVSDLVFTDTTNQTSATTGVIGVNGTGGEQYFFGSISNLRVVKGTAVYTSNFTPPTTPLTAISGTSLLTCQSPSLIDNSTNAFAITAYGNSQPTQQNPFGFTTATTNGYTANTIGGSGYFDGTGDYLVTATDSALALATNAADFTIECWVYNNGGAGSQYGRGICIYYPSAGYGSNRLMFRLVSGGDRINLYLLAGGSAEFGGPGVDGTATVTIGAWTHVALVRNAGVFYAYVNGVLDITVSSSSAASSIPFTTYNIIEVGRTQDGSSPDWFGNISNYRFVKGTAVYTSNFVPPSQPVTAVTNTALLLNMTNAGIIDNAMMNNLDTVGNAQISTTQSQFGGSSMYFDGTGDYLKAPFNPAYSLPGDFTVETWLYLTSAAGIGNQTIASFGYNNSTGDGPWGFYLNGNGPYTLYFNSSPGNHASTTTVAIPINTWTHVTYCRSGSTGRFFVNGTIVGTAISDAFTYSGTTESLFVGIMSDASSAPLYGYIDDLRITKGVARYTTNFTAPTTAFSVY